MNIGVIGLGFVGTAVKKFFTEYGDTVFGYDIKSGVPIDEGYTEVLSNCDTIFLCVPTPMSDDGSCNTDIVRSSLSSLDRCAGLCEKYPIVLVKSTLVPQTMENLISSTSNIKVVSNPEFLTERRAAEDYKESQSVLIGNGYGEEVATKLRSFFSERWPDAEIFITSPTEAELCKYLTNSYFSVKVSIANHLYQLCQKLGIDYDSFITTAIGCDPRIEQTHWRVPGPDGKLGFGGTCFPKDLSGMVYLLDSMNVDADVFKATVAYNDKIR